MDIFYLKNLSTCWVSKHQLFIKCAWAGSVKKTTELTSTRSKIKGFILLYTIALHSFECWLHNLVDSFVYFYYLTVNNVRRIEILTYSFLVRRARWHNWLMFWTPDWAAQIQALARIFVACCWETLPCEPSPKWGIEWKKIGEHGLWIGRSCRTCLTFPLIFFALLCLPMYFCLIAHQRASWYKLDLTFLNPRTTMDSYFDLASRAWTSSCTCASSSKSPV